MIRHAGPYALRTAVLILGFDIGTGEMVSRLQQRATTKAQRPKGGLELQVKKKPTRQTFEVLSRDCRAISPRSVKQGSEALIQDMALALGGPKHICESDGEVKFSKLSPTRPFVVSEESSNLIRGSCS
jgi:hypothetical protein